MIAGFDAAFEHVLGLEGGYVNHPKDPGGETNWGITHWTLEAAKERGIVPRETTVRGLTNEQAKVIYRVMYWDEAGCDKLPFPLAVFVFDAAVNQGHIPAIRVLQEALGVRSDGILGPVTLAAARATDKLEAASIYMAHRALRYTRTRNFETFGLGWLKRLFKICLMAR